MNAPTKDRILPIFVLRREVKEVLGTIILDYLANDSSEYSSNSEEDDIDFILFELACGPKSCLGTRLNLKVVSTLDCE